MTYNASKLSLTVTLVHKGAIIISDYINFITKCTEKYNINLC